MQGLHTGAYMRAASRQSPLQLKAHPPLDMHAGADNSANGSSDALSVCINAMSQLVRMYLADKGPCTPVRLLFLEELSNTLNGCSMAEDLCCNV